MIAVGSLPLSLHCIPLRLLLLMMILISDVRFHVNFDTSNHISHNLIGSAIADM